MEDRAKVAHHEAAHAVLAYVWDLGLADGIDLDAATSVEGAFGNVQVYVRAIDGSLPEEVQQADLICNLSVYCAGAASDAKIKQIDPFEALRAQPGDFGEALRHARSSPLLTDEAMALAAVKVGLATAVGWLEKPYIWVRVERVANAALEVRGKLGKDEIEALCQGIGNAKSNPQA